MKSIVEVLRQKEMELHQIQVEVEALRVALRLVSEEGENYGPSLAATGTSSEGRDSRVNVKEINAGANTTRQFP
jgi:hypothetical protein